MKIKVSVPATSANIGSGFDALGLAVTLYNTVTFEESEVLDISSADGTRIPRGESNLVYRSAKGLFEKVGKQIPPLKITQTNPNPHGARPWFFLGLHHCGTAGCKPDAGRCAQHAGAAHAGHLH